MSPFTFHISGVIVVPTSVLSQLNRLILAGSPDGIRTHTVQGLSLMPLPVGLQGHLIIVGQVGYAPTPSVFQTDASTKLASFAIAESKGIEPLWLLHRLCLANRHITALSTLQW